MNLIKTHLGIAATVVVTLFVLAQVPSLNAIVTKNYFA
jgi:hypothetical protein